LSSSQDLIVCFREFHRLSLTQYENSQALYTDYLQTGCKLFGLNLGIISRIQSGRYTVVAIAPGDSAISVGQTFPVGDTYCSWVVNDAATIAYDKVSADPKRALHPVYQTAKLEAYISTPIWVDDQIYGTLNFSDTEPRSAPFNVEDNELIELLAQGVARVIKHKLSEQRRAVTTASMNENIGLFESAFTYSAIGLALVSLEGRWLRVNRALCEIVGYQREALLVIDFQTITHPDDLNTDLDYLKAMVAGDRKTYQMEKRYFHSDGHVVWVLLSVSLAHKHDGSPKYFVSQIQDISARKQTALEIEQKQRQLEIANHTLKELAARDSLTQLYNRRIFDERFAEELSRCERSKRPLSLLLIDIDHFKSFNDELGHIAGDQALQAVARELNEQGRLTDVVARYGGEEFAIILPDTHDEGALVFAERLRNAISEISELGRALTVSIGCTSLNPLEMNGAHISEENFIRTTDEALYKAKAAGRNCIHKKELCANVNGVRPHISRNKTV